MNEKTQTIVLPSGVELVHGKLKGLHQRLLTEGDNATTGKGINIMLADVIESVGNKNHIDVKFVERMLSADRKFALIQIRDFSIPARFREAFEFDYEFPSEDGKKWKQHYRVEFNEDDFQTRPYHWVKDYMVEHDPQSIWQDDEGKERYAQPFPVVYEDYQQALEQRATTFVLPDSEKEIKWWMITGENEENMAKIKRTRMSTHTPLEAHVPKWFEPNKDATKEPTPIKLNLDQLSIEDIEEFRLDVHNREGYCDTLLTLTHSANASIQNTIDLVGQPAFFFPSQAL